MLPTNYIQSSTVPVDIPKAIANQPLGFNLEIELDTLEELIMLDFLGKSVN